MDDSLGCVARVRLHARVLALQVVRRARGPDALLLLTDHPTPRIVYVVPAAPFEVEAEHVWDLATPGRAAAEYGLGLAVEAPSVDGAPGRWVLAHVYPGQVRLVSLQDAQQTWDARYVRPLTQSRGCGCDCQCGTGTYACDTT